ncbi:AAA ATPase domain [Brachionus plicatilis]|uniref:AAA ATPase domain n=1 Tax=Brachionus plicatilis TaxID=10195 RepID=A0A3M7SQ03_BRAPC|nr:AAA ATPase domain [Brachionus plicatilis]
MENLLDYFGEFSWVNIPNFCLITKGITFSNGDSNVQDVSNGIKCYLIHFDGNFSDLKGERYDEDPRNINKIHKEMQSDFKKIENYDENDFCLRIKGLIKFISENFNDQLENLNDKLKDSTLFGSSIEIIKSDENISSVEFKSDIHLENCDILNYSIEKDENEMLKVKILFKDNNQNEKNYTKKFYPDESNIEKVEVEYLVAKNQKNIKINQLSCGEQIILYLKLWSIIANDVTLKKKFKSDILKNRDILLLLDEPDSFLNPNIVERLDIQVIMTTHNPVTISFVKQFTSLNNIFCLCLNNQKMEIDKCENKENFSKLIHNELNSNLISIHQPFKFVFVEGKDSEFYEYYYEKIRAFDLLIIKTNCQIIFRPVHEKSKSNCHQVRKNIEIMINSISESLKSVDQERWKRKLCSRSN